MSYSYRPFVALCICSRPVYLVEAYCGNQRSPYIGFLIAAATKRSSRVNVHILGFARLPECYVKKLGKLTMRATAHYPRPANAHHLHTLPTCGTQIGEMNVSSPVFEQ